MNKVFKTFDNEKQAKKVFNRICDTINEQGTAGTIRSFCNAFLQGKTIELRSTYFSKATLETFFK